MKKSKIFYATTLAIFLSGCGLTNMVNKYSTVSYTVNPPILQTHGGKVALTLDASFPEKYFAKNVTVDFTPVLVYENGEKAFKTITIQGEEAEGGEKTIFYATGGKFSYQDAVKYNKNMMNSHLELRAIAKEKSNSNNQEKILGPIKLADGVLATPTRVLNNENIANQNHEYEHQTILEETASIYFLVNQANIRTTEKSDDDIEKLKAFANNGYKTHSIEIMSYASPEGSVSTNDDVSEKRMNATVSYIKNLLNSLKVDGAKNDEIYTQTSIGEDWEGFESIVRSSTIQDKRRINKIVNSVEDLELREQQIRDLSEIYDALENDVLPQLRKAVIVIRSFEPKRTDVEIANLSTTYPDSLNVKELLFSATLTNDKNTQRAIYNSVIELHNDWRGYNNLAGIYMQENNIAEAQRNLSKAEEIGGQQSDILTNKGILAAWSGALKHAQTKFDKAKTTDLNQAILDIRQGEYAKASRFFKNKKSHNATLSQIMNGKNNPNCNENTAACHYLNAIASARSGNNEGTISNLRKAININASYKHEALIDLEFINLRENETFITLIK